jgi:hypothetical protein
MLTPELKSFAAGIIVSELNKFPNIFNMKYINNLLGKNSNSGKIWTLLNLALWNKTWF